MRNPRKPYLYLEIAELAIDRNNVHPDALVIYPSLIDMYATSKDLLDSLTGALQREKIFNFGNTGRYAGIDNKTKLHFTFDDGIDSIDWLKRVCIMMIHFKSVLHTDTRVKLSKSTLMERGVYVGTNPPIKLSRAQEDKIITAYITGIKRALNRSEAMYGISIQQKIESPLKINTSRDKVIIDSRSIGINYNTIQ